MRVVEHNIRVLAKYYTRISIKHFADLLHLDLKVGFVYFEIKLICFCCFCPLTINKYDQIRSNMFKNKFTYRIS